MYLPLINFVRGVNKQMKPEQKSHCPIFLRADFFKIQRLVSSVFRSKPAARQTWIGITWLSRFDWNVYR
ncbi:hypothetical protein ADM99_13435 [Leptolinea tardivitalis]|uniref:Uncharacterized protein n=1 Tax=Leptolinea tardivitalis TaxID=229920 RepID=A0A0P6WU23_9CHLR|nr:hypothetical protein ADM99_13435 [Leptolinea tardivitalis]